MMKKRFLLVTVMALLLVLFPACSSEEESSRKSGKGDTKVEESEDEVKEDETEEEEIIETEESEDDTVSEDESGFSFGYQDGNVYTNEFIGIGCEFEDDWTFMTEEEIQAANNIAVGLYDDEIDEAIESSQTLFDTMVTSPTGSNVNVTLTNVGVAGYLDNPSELLELSLSTMQSTLESAGAENVVVTETEREFAGETWVSVDISQTLYDVQFYQTAVYKFCGNYLVAVTATGMEEGESGEILDAFYALD